MRKKGATIVKELCDANYLELLSQDSIESPTDWMKRRVVRCMDCGRNYEAIIRKGNVTPCVCKSTRVMDPDQQYERARTILEEAGRELLTPRAEWVGFKCGAKELKYSMRCKKCGAVFDSIIRSGRMSPCPNCERKVATQDDTYIRFLRQLSENDLSPLFTRDDWRGVVHAVRGSISEPNKYPVRCNKCGCEYEARIVPGRTSAGVNKCPECGKDYVTREGTYVRFIKLLEKQNLTPLFSFAEWTGAFRRIEGKLTRNFYKVKCNLCGAEYEVARTTTGGVTLCNCQRTDHVYRCKRERYMEQWLREKGLNVIPCDRTVLHGHELDLYLPDQRIAFEFNGMYFHSSSPRNPSNRPRAYHRDKTAAAVASGIKLYHIWEDTPDELVQSIIEAKLDILPIRYYARNLELRQVPPSETVEFFKRCHVDGAVRVSRFAVGLFTPDGKMQCCLSIMQRRTQNTGEYAWEIGRFATELHTHVVGGYSRLLKAAIRLLRENTDCTELVSYCNRDLSPNENETFYMKNGFRFVGDSGLIYWYWAQYPTVINGKTYEGRIPRQAVQKSLLLKHFQDNGLALPPKVTEATLAEILDIVPVYNSGNFKFMKSI